MANSLGKPFQILFTVISALASSNGFSQVRGSIDSTQPSSQIVPGYIVTKGDLAALQQDIRRERVAGVAEAVNETGLREGIPDYILDYAERHRPKPVESSRLGALEMIVGSVQNFLNQNKIASVVPGDDPPEVRHGETVVDATKRPALFLCKNAINDPVPPLWYQTVNNTNFTRSLAAVSASVGLIRIKWPYELSSSPIGTGFVVGKNIVLTNRHVAEAFAEADGSFIASRLNANVRLHATIDFSGEKCQRPAAICNVVAVPYMAPPNGPDLAILRIEAAPGATIPPPVELELGRPAPSEEGDNPSMRARRVGELVYIVGYPFHDTRVPDTVEYSVFGDPLGVKRIAFGQLQEASGLGNNGILVYDCSTLGGCSGSPLVDLSSGKVWGLHFAGVFKCANYAWPLWALCQDPKVKALLTNQ